MDQDRFEVIQICFINKLFVTNNIDNVQNSTGALAWNMKIKSIFQIIAKDLNKEEKLINYIQTGEFNKVN